MTLSDGELMNIHKMIYPYMYHFLLPLLRCDDITWNETSLRIFMAGEVLITMGHKYGLMTVKVAKKFCQNGNIVECDNNGYGLKIHANKIVVSWWEDGYYHLEKLAYGFCRQNKRHISANSSASYRMPVLETFGHKVFFVV